jgi:hypothetical protein
VDIVGRKVGDKLQLKRGKIKRKQIRGYITKKEITVKNMGYYLIIKYCRIATNPEIVRICQKILKKVKRK